MKALVMLVPTDLGKSQELIKKVLAEYKENPIPTFLNELKKEFSFIEDVVKSKIILFPSYVSKLEFLKGDNEASSLILDDNPNKKWYENRLKYLQFVDGTYIKLTGKIVTIDLAADENDDGIKSILKYDKMSSEAKKKYRQKVGKNLIEYLSNMTIINQLNNWAALNEVPENYVVKKENEQEQNQNPQQPSPSSEQNEQQVKAPQPSPPKVGTSTEIGISRQVGIDSDYIQTIDNSQDEVRYEKVTKSMWIIYFRETKTDEKGEKTGENPNAEQKSMSEWTEMSDADREYRHQLVKQKLEVIDRQIESLDKGIKDELDIIEKRDIKSKEILQKYGNEGNMRVRMTAIDAEMLRAVHPQTVILKNEMSDINETLDKINLDIMSVNKMKKYRAEKNRILEERKEVEKSQVKSVAEHEEEKEKKNIKRWTEELLGIELGLPVRYMHIPEVELLGYNEILKISEKTEGTFEIYFQHLTKNGEYVEVGDPVSFMMQKAGDLWDIASKIVGGIKDKKGENDGK